MSLTAINWTPTLLIIGMVSALLCVVAWRNQPRYAYPEGTILGAMERTPGFVVCYPLDECASCREYKKSHIDAWKAWKPILMGDATNDEE